MYSEKFYIKNKASAQSSAEELTKLVYKILRPMSVVDVGCATGVFLKEFKKRGVKEILGVDSIQMNTDLLEIPKTSFIGHDLRKPLRMKRRFDLVVSLETAEHIESECANTLIDTIVKLGDIILFSAAIPYQGGTHHVNEQWQSYWAEKFAKRGYVPVNFLRSIIWTNEKVSPDYRQNILLYVKKGRLHGGLLKLYNGTKDIPLDVAHPLYYIQNADPMFYVRHMDTRKNYTLLMKGIYYMPLHVMRNLFKKMK